MHEVIALPDMKHRIRIFAEPGTITALQSVMTTAYLHSLECSSHPIDKYTSK